MVGLRFAFNDDTEYIVDGTGVMDWGKYTQEQNLGEVSYFENESAKVAKTVLLVGDSYRSSMIPALSETFSKVYVVHRASYSTDIIDRVKPEYIISEYVERYSSDIKTISFMIES